jgi:hypothetical protein
MRSEQDPAKLPESPLLLGDVPTIEPIQGEPDQASEEFQPSVRPSVTSLTEEALFSHRPLGIPEEYRL